MALPPYPVLQAEEPPACAAATMRRAEAYLSSRSDYADLLRQKFFFTQARPCLRPGCRRLPT